MLKRKRSGRPTLHLPETNSSGGRFPAPEGTAPKDYAMDGPIGVFARYKNNGSEVTEAFLYPTLRRGGRTVYAFDVTSKTNPKFKWTITGGSGDYAKLAQTWSRPKPVVLSADSGAPDVLLLMGGGYDKAEDTNGRSDIGNVVYVINGRTGALIKALPTEYSVPSDVTVVNANPEASKDPDRPHAAELAHRQPQPLTLSEAFSATLLVA